MAGDVYDAPNQQVVRPDGSAPWDEGTGGSSRSGNGDDRPAGRRPGRPRKDERREAEGRDEPKDDEGES